MRVLDKLAGNQFLVIGRCGMDLCPDPPGTATPDGDMFQASLGGSSANIAVALCKLGAKASLITCVSSDPVGRFCLNKLQGYGVDTSHIRQITGEYRTSLAIYESRLVDHETVIYRNGPADFQMDMQDIDGLDYQGAAGLITTGTVFARDPSRSASLAAMQKAKAAQIPVLFDIDYRPYSWTSPQDASAVLKEAAGLSDVIIGNDVEFDFMAGRKRAGLALARELGADPNRIIVYKMGELGAITITGGSEFRTGIFKVEALKPTGAGDSFMGAFIATLASGGDLREAVVKGSANAAYVVARVGCAMAMPDAATLDNFIATHPGMTEV